MKEKYLLNDIALADWESVCIIDTDLDSVVLHFNITPSFNYESALKLGKKIVSNLNLEK